jgi:hypothetical protein
MQNPWDPDNATIPDNGGVRRSGRRLTLLGVTLWITVIGISGSVLFLTDVGHQKATTLLFDIGQVTTIALGFAATGWITYLILHYLDLFGGILASLFKLGFIFGIFPLGIWITVQQFDLFAGPVTRSLLQSLPIDTNTITQLSEQFLDLFFG